MLKKINRISRRKEFEDMKAAGRFIGFSRFFGVVVLNENSDELRFGVVVSKKISKKAVERNKIKRRIMEVLKKRLDGFSKGKKILFLVKKDLLGVKPAEIERELEKMMPKINKP